MTPMRFRLAGLFLVVALPAHAADAIYEAPPEAPLAPQIQASTWAGPYIGIYGGYRFLGANLSGLADDHVDGLDGGLYGGYNFDLGSNWVAGFEGTAGISGADGGQDGVNVEEDWNAALRGRLGYSLGDSLIYGLAGLAGTHASVSTSAGSDSDVMLGWQVGAGFESMLTQNVVGRIEYDYSDYGSTDLSPGGVPTSLDLSGHALKVGVGLKF